MNVELASCSFCGCSDPIVDRQERISGPVVIKAGWPTAVPGLMKRSSALSFMVKRRDLRAVVPRQIFPLPTRAIFRSDKVTRRRQDRLNAFHAGANDARGEIVDPFE